MDNQSRDAYCQHDWKLWMQIFDTKVFFNGSYGGKVHINLNNILYINEHDNYMYKACTTALKINCFIF